MRSGSISSEPNSLSPWQLLHMTQHILGRSVVDKSRGTARMSPYAQQARIAVGCVTHRAIHGISHWQSVCTVLHASRLSSRLSSLGTVSHRGTADTPFLPSGNAVALSSRADSPAYRTTGFASEANVQQRNCTSDLALMLNAIDKTVDLSGHVAIDGGRSSQLAAPWRDRSLSGE